MSLARGRRRARRGPPRGGGALHQFPCQPNLSRSPVSSVRSPPTPLTLFPLDTSKLLKVSCDGNQSVPGPARRPPRRGKPLERTRQGRVNHPHHAVQRVSNPQFLTLTQSHDVASNLNVVA